MLLARREGGHSLRTNGWEGGEVGGDSHRTRSATIKTEIYQGSIYQGQERENRSISGHDLVPRERRKLRIFDEYIRTQIKARREVKARWRHRPANSRPVGQSPSIVYKVQRAQRPTLCWRADLVSVAVNAYGFMDQRNQTR